MSAAEYFITTGCFICITHMHVNQTANGHIMRGMEMNIQMTGEGKPFIDTSSLFLEMTVII